MGKEEQIKKRTVRSLLEGKWTPTTHHMLLATEATLQTRMKWDRVRETFPAFPNHCMWGMIKTVLWHSTLFPGFCYHKLICWPQNQNAHRSCSSSCSPQVSENRVVANTSHTLFSTWASRIGNMADAVFQPRHYCNCTASGRRLGQQLLQHSSNSRELISGHSEAEWSSSNLLNPFSASQIYRLTPPVRCPKWASHYAPGLWLPTTFFYLPMCVVVFVFPISISEIC